MSENDVNNNQGNQTQPEITTAITTVNTPKPIGADENEPIETPVDNQTESGQINVQIRLLGTPKTRYSFEPDVTINQILALPELAVDQAKNYVDFQINGDPIPATDWHKTGIVKNSDQISIGQKVKNA